MTLARLGTAVAIAAAAFIVGAVFGQPGSGRAGTSGAPTNTAAPTISGTTQEGKTLTASTGTWTGSPTSYAYAWSRCDAYGKSCAAIAKATAATYTVASDDVGHTLEVTVTATNASGSAQATSKPTGVVVKTAAPKNTALPLVTGTLQLGSTLTVSNGTWDGSPTSYAYSWSRCDPSGDHCSLVSGAAKSTYTVTSADSGATLRASVTATNAGGSTQATSVPTALVPAPNGCPAGTGTIQIADLQQPARLMVEHASVEPAPVTLRTRSIRLTIKVTACNGRPVQGAQVSAVAIPYDQFAGNSGTTGADGTATLTELRESGFPARSSRQGLLAVLVHATKPGGSTLGGVSTRRTVAFEVASY